MNRWLVVMVLLSAILPSCNSASSDLSIVSKVIRREANVSSAVPSEFAAATPSTGELFWVEGKVRNGGTTDVANVTITFRCTDGNTKRLFVAVVPRIPAGATADFRTDKYPSPLEIKFVDQEPELTIGK
jgi:hypothetical protein